MLPYLPLFLSLCLTLSLSVSHTHTFSLFHFLTLSLSLSVCPSLSVSLSLIPPLFLLHSFILISLLISLFFMFSSGSNSLLYPRPNHSLHEKNLRMNQSKKNHSTCASTSGFTRSESGIPVKPRSAAIDLDRVKQNFYFK